MGTAQSFLDRVHSLAQLEKVEAEPGSFARLLAADLGAAATLGDLEARDAALAVAIGNLDAMLVRAMRLRLDHALAADSSIGTPTRNVFAATIAGYQHDLPLLGQRAYDIALRGRAPDPAQIADLVVEQARAVLALRTAMRSSLLDLIRDLATAAVPEADRNARDRKRGEPERKRWSAARRELEAIAVDPERVLAAPLAMRLTAFPDLLDEPEPEPEPTFKDLLELD